VVWESNLLKWRNKKVNKPKVALTVKSANKKTGAIPVSKTERDSCPVSCPFYRDGCYGEYGPLAWHWKKMDQNQNANGSPIDTEWDSFLEKIKELPSGQIWRHNEVGDLPSGETSEDINFDLLKEIVSANEGLRGFTYTHKHVEKKNLPFIKFANDNGFTVNLSANNVDHADELVSHDVGPVTVVVPLDVTENFKTPAGNKVVICPNVTHDVSCKDCALCAVSTRKTIVAFPAHGVKKKSVSLRVV